MNHPLRPYQKKGEHDIRVSLSKNRASLYVLPTGAGKTILFGKILYDHVGCSVAIAHREKLVSQISMALANYGVMHRIIGE